ncbi:MAG: hypothetical protein WDO56_28200 [Gammaproteobacteria bacterium]
MGDSRTSVGSDRELVFADRVGCCVSEIDAVLTPLAARFGAFAVMTALAESLGGVLREVMQQEALEPEAVRRVVRHAEVVAFTRSPAQPN